MFSTTAEDFSPSTIVFNCSFTSIRYSEMINWYWEKKWFKLWFSKLFELCAYLWHFLLQKVSEQPNWWAMNVEAFYRLLFALETEQSPRNRNQKRKNAFNNLSVKFEELEGFGDGRFHSGTNSVQTVRMWHGKVGFPIRDFCRGRSVRRSG